jgi:hypothetical protein
MVTFNKNLLILKTKIMKTKNFILRICLVLLLLTSPFQTKMLAAPVGTCDLLSLQLTVPDDSDCQVFYLCVNVPAVGTVFVKNVCPPGLGYDVNSKTCNWLDAVSNPACD